MGILSSPRGARAVLRRWVPASAETPYLDESLKPDEGIRLRLRADYQADAVEMEGAAVGQVAAFFGIPAVVVRSLSDLAGAESHLDFDRFVSVVAPDAARVMRRLAAVI